MSSFSSGRSSSNYVLSRQTLLLMLRAALQTGEFRFARQAALTWLAAFPGDMEVGLFQAQAITAEGRPRQVIPALDLICRKDPFSSEAYWLLAQAADGNDPNRYDFALSSLFVFDGAISARASLAEWAVPLRQAYLALQETQYVAAEKSVQEALSSSPDLLLAAAMHLLVDRATLDPLSIQHLADIYHTRWPDCLLVSLILAEANLSLGAEPEAVRLLHLCAAGDSTGQVARRLWGEEHPYRSLWPEDMVIPFEVPVPAAVAARLGWNHLAPGEIRLVEPEPKGLLIDVDEIINETSGDSGNTFGEEVFQEAAEEAGGPDDQPQAQETSLVDESGEALPPDSPMLWPETADSQCDEPPVAVEYAEQSAAEEAELQADAEAAKKPARSSAQLNGQRKPAGSDTAHAVENEFERLAKKLKQPVLGRADGRQPVYVIFTSKEGLCGQYGPQTSFVLENELRKLALQMQKRPGWGSLVYYPDDASCTAQYGLTPVNPRDPWKLKNALADLDKALAKTGQMIGALLIIGGDAVVPFHRLPNPTEDADGEVTSDSPYATLDANYFVPEWPVGRLPGEKGPEVTLLLEQIRLAMRKQNRRKTVPAVLGLDWWLMLRGLFGRMLLQPKLPSFGYTAAVWRRSSLAVFRPIGAPHTVMASPPAHSGSIDRERITGSNLGYYNLHGLEDSPAWYGQRDPLEGGDAPDYPVAVTPDDLHRNGHAPRVIFSEACYGGHIIEKRECESLALKFLSMGTQAVVASTGISYGSINTPLIAADLLGNLFWQQLKTGRPVGEALMQAKVDLVREMNRRQGFLDGEDQKTLISFVLYGDPLATYDGFRTQRKTAYRLKDHPMVKTVSDRAEDGAVPPKLSGEALKQVKQIVAEYLPGADMANLHLVRQSIPVNGKPGGDVSAKKQAANLSSHLVVTVSKQVRTGHYVHKHYVRVTLDEAGKPVKLSISR